MSIPEDLKTLRLVPHPIARDKAVAAVKLPEGSTVISVPALSSVLLDSEKGRRCDACHRHQSEERVLRRCTGCASYWYCDAKCQNMQWRSHHKRICKVYNKFMSSPQVQSLAPHEKMDSLLLTHLVAQTCLTSAPENEELSPMSVFLSLIPGPTMDDATPCVCLINPPVSNDVLRSLYSRFGNNNFAMHSHLTTYGHGIFPLASRLFNHSCVPNAGVKYIMSPAKPVAMEVVALRDILPGEEVCIPYLDPALLQTRHQMFEFTYGFKCDCSSCNTLRDIGRIPAKPADPEELLALSHGLRALVGIQDWVPQTLPTKTFESTPDSLLPVLNESYMGELSETFSKSSHGGEYQRALDAGITLLALYLLVYPPNYPQIGMHLLELAKTRWNACVSSGEACTEETKEEVRICLSLGRKILMVLGPEGDEDGPLQEIQVLEGLLDQ